MPDDSQFLILPGESEAEFLQHKEGWLQEYQPQTEVARHLVSEVAVAHWYLMRVRRWYNQALQKKPDPLRWSEQERQEMDRATRDRIAAERSFQRALHNLEQFRKTRVREAMQELKLLQAVQPASPQPAGARKRTPAPEPPPPQSPKDALFQGQNAKKNKRKLGVLDQWAEITRDEQGNTITELIPSNEELIKEGQAMETPPDLVYRRFHFVNGVPPEYYWTTSSSERRQSGGFATQRMAVETWLDTIEREKASGSHHIGPCGKNLARPKERGECECPVCLSLSPDP
jgi:hypothetical protein